MTSLHKFWTGLFFLLLVACGTDTGNPGIRAPLGNQAEDNQFFSSTLVTTVCGKLINCHDDLNQKRCELGIYTHELITQKLNLNSTVYLNLAEVFDAEVRGSLNPNFENTEQCIMDIQTLSCEDKGVQEAFLKEKSSSFEKSHQIIPSSCENTFQ